jgi:hypothetical protein
VCVGEGTVSVTFSLQYGLDDGIMLITGSDRYKYYKNNNDLSDVHILLLTQYLFYY